MTAFSDSKRAPVQGYAAGIPWDLHLEAYSAYCKRYGRQQALIEGGCRGGFHAEELDVFLPGWREKVSALGIAEERIATLERNAQVMMHVELELRHCIRQLLQLHGKPLERGTLRDHLYALDLVTPGGKIYLPGSVNS